ncbi:MAG: S-layer homology domain-containing protein [Candidatus Saganbacteria bacterium]|nr:S-layer homology domain-containing protein [Candidatus Saganbacteria bacterium]
MKLGVGARSLAMGRTAVAVSGDINSMFINPANAADLRDWGATSMYTSLLEGDIAYTLLGGGKKFDRGTFGLAYMGSGVVSGIDVTTRDADSRIVSSGSSFNYHNSVISLVWGKEILEKLSAGALLKIFNKGFSGVSNGNGSGYDLDLGILWKQNEKLTLGLSQQNTLPISMGGAINWGTGASEGIPFNTKLGLTYLPRDSIFLALDLDYAGNQPLVFHGGLEWMLKDFLSIRGGFEQVPTSKSESTANLSAGVGLKFRGFKFDYAYYLDNVLSVNSTHFFTLSFLPPEIKRVYEKPRKETKPMFIDVPSDYWARTAIEYLAKAKIISGYPDGSYKPLKALSRAELCTLLIKAKGIPLPKIKGKVFKDVNARHWAAPYIKAAANYGLVKGYKNGTFKPKGLLTREEAIKILAVFDKLPLKNQRPTYSDISSDRWSMSYIAAAQAQGWLHYIKGNEFEPKQKFSRAEGAFILYITSFIQEQ